MIFLLLSHCPSPPYLYLMPGFTCVAYFCICPQPRGMPRFFKFWPRHDVTGLNRANDVHILGANLPLDLRAQSLVVLVIHHNRTFHLLISLLHILISSTPPFISLASSQAPTVTNDLGLINLIHSYPFSSILKSASFFWPLIIFCQTPQGLYADRFQKQRPANTHTHTHSALSPLSVQLS